MTTELEAQLRDYFEAFDETLTPIVVEELASHGERSRIAGRTRLLPGWAVAAAAFVAVLILTGGVLLLLRMNTGEPPVATSITTPPTTAAPPTTTITPPATTSTAPPETTTTSPSAAPEPAPITWQRIDWGVPSEGGNLVIGGPGYVVASAICRKADWSIDRFVCEDSRPAVWVSSDAVTWEEVGQDTFVGYAGGLSDVATGPDGLVAIGNVAREGLAFTSGAVWTSPDGAEWTQFSDVDRTFVGAGPTILESVTAGGPGYVIVGWDNVYGENSNAMVWTSEDGRTWTHVDDDDLLGDPDTGDIAEMYGVVSGDGGLVAWGSSVWVSSDGFDWERVSELAFSGVTVSPATGSFLAFTHSGEVWTSTDGRTWNATAAHPLGAAWVEAAWNGSNLLLAGQSDLADNPTLWLSRDEGATWSELDDPAFEPPEGRVFRIGNLEFQGNTLVVSGADCDSRIPEDDCQGVAWIGTWNE